MNTLSNVNKKFALVLLLLTLVFAIPFTISELRKQQEIRSRAEAEAVAFSFNPQTSSKQVGEDLDVAVSLNGKTNNITAVDVTIAFDTTLLEVTSFTPSGVFNTQFINQTDNTVGMLRYAAGNTTPTPITGIITLGTIRFKPKAQGIATVTVQKSQVYASGRGGVALPVDPVIPGNYTITAATLPTPTPSPSPTPLPTATPTLAPTSTPIPLPTNTPAPSPTSPPLPTPTPITIIPTPTFIPGGMQLEFSLQLAGIGGPSENTNPKTVQKVLTVELLDPGDNPVASKTGFIMYDGQEKVFKGIVDLGVAVPAGNYSIKIQTEKYLKKRIPVIYTLTPGLKHTISLAKLTVGDINGDNRVDILDYEILRSCFEDKANSAACGSNKQLANLDDDTLEKVDGVDYYVFVRSLSVREGD